MSEAQPDNTLRIEMDGMLIFSGLPDIAFPKWLALGKAVELIEAYRPYAGTMPCRRGIVIEHVGNTAFGIPKVGLALYDDVGVRHGSTIDFTATELLPVHGDEEDHENAEHWREVFRKAWRDLLEITENTDD